MFAQLGNITFYLITYFDKIDSSNSYNYATHQTLEGKPKLQFLGEGLEMSQIELSFHQSFCDPNEELKKLKELAKAGKAYNFMFGNGEQKGKYVIENIAVASEQTDGFGNLTSIKVAISLLECPETLTLEAKNQQKKNQAKTKAKATRAGMLKQKIKSVKIPPAVKQAVKMSMLTSPQQALRGIARQGWLNSSVQTNYSKMYGAV